MTAYGSLPPGEDGVLRSPTFFVGAERQKQNMADFQRREQQLAEAYHKNKPLCFRGHAFQRTHPGKAMKGHKDADATRVAPLILGVADGVSQIEEFGINAAELPHELLQVCEELAMHQLIPDVPRAEEDMYKGPVALLRRAFEATERLGSLTVVLAIMDNSTRIHGKRHPMIAIVTVGDCELLILRRVQGRMGPLHAICHTEMQRIDGHCQTPLQLARVDDRIDPDFHDGITIDVIEKGSAVHCVSAYEGDILVMGSDGVFDNLFLDEITAMCNNAMPPGSQVPIPEATLARLAEEIVWACHAKTKPSPSGHLPEAPIGRGGKKDDTAVVIGEVVEWTEAQRKYWAPRRPRPRPPREAPGARSLAMQWMGFLGSIDAITDPFDNCCAAFGYESEEHEDHIQKFGAEDAERGKGEASPKSVSSPMVPAMCVLRDAGRSGSGYAR